MRSTFFGLEIGRKALQAQQKALDVTGHNIANANTKGYSRQEAVMAADIPYGIPGLHRATGAGQVGSGVTIEQIRRLRDGFLDMQYRNETKALGYWESMKEALTKVEVILNEPSDAGLRDVMDKFWESWQELSKNQEDSVRATVRQQALALTEAFKHTYRQLSELQDDLNVDVKIKVGQINMIANQIRDLNEEIVRIEAVGYRANDLRDKRDVLIDDLSRIVDTRVSEDKTGAVTVMVGGRAMIVGSQVIGVRVEENPANNGWFDVKWADVDQNVAFTSGEIKALLEMRDTNIKDYRDKLDALALGIITAVNDQHRQGFSLNNNDDQPDDIPFFTGTGASDIDITNEIATDLNNIAAALKQTNNVTDAYDGSNALAIAQLRNAKLMNSNLTTFDDYFRSLVSEIGVQSQEAGRMSENQSLLVSQLDSNRQQVAGVSLDEEMTNMVRFQHAYNAAARLVTAVDEMLDVLINRMGTVGR